MGILRLQQILILSIWLLISSQSFASNAVHVIGWQTFGEVGVQVNDPSPDTNSTFDTTPEGSIASSNHYLTGAIGPSASVYGYSGHEESTTSSFLNGEWFGSSEINSNDGNPKGALITDYSLADGSAGARIGPLGQAGTSSWAFRNAACLGKNTSTCNIPGPVIGTDEDGNDIYGRTVGNHLVGWQTFDRYTAGNNNSGVKDSTPENNSSYIIDGNGAMTGSHYLTGNLGYGITPNNRKGYGINISTQWLGGDNFGGNGLGEAIEDWDMADGSAGTRVMPYGATNPGTNATKTPTVWKFSNSSGTPSLQGDLSITNSSNDYFRLDFIHLDGRMGAASSPDSLGVYYVPAAGNITLKKTCSEPGVLANGDEELKLLEQYEWSGVGVEQVSLNVSSSLNSTVYIAPGDTAVFRVAWSGGGSGQSFIDNLAFEGTFFGSQALETALEPSALHDGSSPEACTIDQQIGQQYGDVIISNDSDFYFRPDKIHFSALSQSPGAPKKLELVYLAAPGNLINMVENVLHTESWLSEDSAGLNDERNITVCMSCKGTINEYGARTYIGPGEKAAFRFQWGQADGKGPAFIDNIAFQGRFYDSTELQKVGYHVDPLTGEIIYETVDVPFLPFLFSIILMVGLALTAKLSRLKLRK